MGRKENTKKEKALPVGAMETIALGSQGLKVSKLGYGCMGLTTAYGAKMPDEEIVALLEKVYEAGVTFWDTASIYAVS